MANVDLNPVESK